jgi:hypothetical protein
MDWDSAVEKEGKEFANTFSRFVNNMNREPKKHAIEAMLRDHPTLQQGMMRFFMEFVEGMAEQRGDLRNEGSIALAKEILKIKNRCLPFV